MPKTVLLIDKNPLSSLKHFEAFLVEQGFLTALPKEAFEALGESRAGRIVIDLKPLEISDGAIAGH